MDYNRRRYPNSRRNCNCQMPIEPRENQSENNQNIDMALAMCYVPWQQFSTTFDLTRGFQTGTIFPELDKPFMAAGRCARL